MGTSTRCIKLMLRGNKLSYNTLSCNPLIARVHFTCYSAFQMKENNIIYGRAMEINANKAD